MSTKKRPRCPAVSHFLEIKKTVLPSDFLALLKKSCYFLLMDQKRAKTLPLLSHLIVVQQKMISTGITFSEEFPQHGGGGCLKKIHHFHHCLHHFSMLI